MGTNSDVNRWLNPNLGLGERSAMKIWIVIAAFREAKGIMARECCNNDENCSFIVHSVTALKSR